MDNQEIRVGASQTAQAAQIRGGDDEQRGESKPKAAFNAPATSKYLKLISRDRALVSEGLQRSLGSVQSTLDDYLSNPDKAAAVRPQENGGGGAQARLFSPIVSPDPALSEKVAQDLSSSHRLVRSREASDELERTLDRLPPALSEETAAGSALSKTITQSLLNLTDHETLGAGLERDLAVRGVYVPDREPSARAREATSRVLQVSIAYAQSNSPEALSELEPEAKPAREVPGATTPQIMTRYLRQALNDFPDDSTYLDIFKQNRKQPEFDDRVSKETSERIRNIIAKAAETARRGNLIPGQTAPEENSESYASAKEGGAAQSALSRDSADGRELTLSELSERASRLQRQFRLERQKLAAQGQLPDPAAYPKDASPAKVRAAVAEAVKAQPEAAAAAAPKEASASQKPQEAQAKTAEEAVRSEIKATEAKAQAPAAKSESAPEAEETAPKLQSPAVSLKEASFKVSYKAVQNPFFGGLSSVPGMTLPVQDFAEDTLTKFADASQVQDLSTPRTLNQVLTEQQRVTEAAKPQVQAEALSQNTAAPSSAPERQAPESAPAAAAQTAVAEKLSAQNAAAAKAAAAPEPEAAPEIPAETPEENVAKKTDTAAANTKTVNAAPAENTGAAKAAAAPESDAAAAQKSAAPKPEVTRPGSKAATSAPDAPETTPETPETAPESSDRNAAKKTEAAAPNAKTVSTAPAETAAKTASVPEGKAAVPEEASAKQSETAAQSAKTVNAAPEENAPAAKAAAEGNTPAPAESAAKKTELSSQSANTATAAASAPGGAAEAADTDGAAAEKAAASQQDARASAASEALKADKTSPDTVAAEKEPKADKPATGPGDDKVKAQENAKDSTALKSEAKASDRPQAAADKPQSQEVSLRATELKDQTAEAAKQRAAEGAKTAAQTASKEPATTVAEEPVSKNAQAPQNTAAAKPQQNAAAVSPAPAPEAETPASATAQTKAQAAAAAPQPAASEVQAADQESAPAKAPADQLQAEQLKNQNQAVQNAQVKAQPQSQPQAQNSTAAAQAAEAEAAVPQATGAGNAAASQSTATASAQAQNAATESAPAASAQAQITSGDTEAPAADEGESAVTEKTSAKAAERNSASAANTDAKAAPKDGSRAQSAQPQSTPAGESSQSAAKASGSSQSAAGETQMSPAAGAASQEVFSKAASAAGSNAAKAPESTEQAWAQAQGQALNAADDSAAEADESAQAQNGAKAEAATAKLTASDKGTASASGEAQASEKVSLGDELMKGTVPASELDDSDTPADAPAGRNLGREAAASINTRSEERNEDVITATRPLDAPAAAAVTQGGSVPVPDESVVAKTQGSVKEGGLFRKLASLFGGKSSKAAQAQQAPAPVMPSALPQVLKGSPLDSLTAALSAMAGNRFLPPGVKSLAEKLKTQLEDPVADLPSVDSWLEFVTGPMSPTSPRATAMHQWAFFILCLRFKELGKSVDKFLRKNGISAKVDGALDDMLLSHQDDDHVTEKLSDSTLNQLQRLQSLSDPVQGSLFSRYIPLPPAYDGGHEGSLMLRKEEKDGKKVWHLEFSFDLKDLGAVGIKAVATLPEVRLSYVAQTLQGLQAMQQHLPELEQQLTDLGLEPKSSKPRLGRIELQERPQVQNAGRNDGSTLSVDI